MGVELSFYRGSLLATGVVQLSASSFGVVLRPFELVLVLVLAQIDELTIS